MAGNGEIIKEFFVLLGLETDKVDFDSAEKRIEKIGTGLKWAAGAATALGATLAAVTNDFVRQTTYVDRWAAKLGDTTETVSGLDATFQAFIGDGEKGLEVISDGAERVGDVVTNVKKLTGDAGEALARLGFKNIDELKGANGQVLEAIPLFGLLADRLAQVEDAGQRTGIAMQLFGDTGRDIIPFIQEFGGDLQRAIQQANRFGAVVGESDVAAVREFRLAAGGATLSLRGLGYTVGRIVLPQVTRYALRISEIISRNREAIKTGLDKWLGRLGRAFDMAVRKGATYLRALDNVVQALGGADRVAKVLGATLGGYLLIQIGSAITAIGGLNVALTGLNAELLLLKGRAALAGGAFGLFFLVMEDVIITIGGGDGVIGRFVDYFSPDAFDPNESAIVKALRLTVGYLREIISYPAAIRDWLFGDEAEERAGVGHMTRVGVSQGNLQKSVAEDFTGTFFLRRGYVARAFEAIMSGEAGASLSGLVQGIGNQASAIAASASAGVAAASRFNINDHFNPNDYATGVNARLRAVEAGFVGTTGANKTPISIGEVNLGMQVNNASDPEAAGRAAAGGFVSRLREEYE